MGPVRKFGHIQRLFELSLQRADHQAARAGYLRVRLNHTHPPPVKAEIQEAEPEHAGSSLRTTEVPLKRTGVLPATVISLRPFALKATQTLPKV